MQTITFINLYLSSNHNLICSHIIAFSKMLKVYHIVLQKGDVDHAVMELFTIKISFGQFLRANTISIFHSDIYCVKYS